MRFKKWLLKELQKGKKTTLTKTELDFAADVKQDADFPDIRSAERTRDYVRHGDVCIQRAAITVFKKWKDNDPKAVIDGMSLRDIARLRSATRKVWSWSYPKRLCVERAVDGKGFPKCELCKKRVPKIFVDHIVPVGALDEGYFERLFCPSSGLQGLCKNCHSAKTKLERSNSKRKGVKAWGF